LLPLFSRSEGVHVIINANEDGFPFSKTLFTNQSKFRNVVVVVVVAKVVKKVHKASAP
jgi:hypothetical protein